jgi:diguanylate cyclase (GGDEF)-like protein
LKQHILIFSRIPEDVETLERALDPDYKVTSAANRDNTLKIALSDFSPDLILLDFTTEGCDICKNLNDSAKTHRIPVLFIKEADKAEDEIKGFELGASDYIEKPLTAAFIKARVKPHLELKRCCEGMELSSLDTVTGIPDRCRFERVLELEWRLGVREKTLLSLIILSIDYFSEFKKEYNAAAADNCLMQVAKTLENSVNRPMDFVARYSEEEFAVILPRTDMKGTLFVAETMRKNIKKLNISNRCSPIKPYITLSTGAGTLIPSKTFSPAFLLEGARKSLEEAKRKGGNQVKGLDLRASLPAVPPEFL